MTLQITITLPDDHPIVRQLLAGLGADTTLVGPAPATAPAADEAPAPKATRRAPKPTEAPVAAAPPADLVPKCTLDDIRKALSALAAARGGDTKVLEELFNRHKLTKLSALDESRYDMFMADVQAQLKAAS